MYVQTFRVGAIHSADDVSGLHVPMSVLPLGNFTCVDRADPITDFLKVVSTDFVYLNGDHIPTHQYSVTQYERDLRKGDGPSRDEHGRESTLSSGLIGIC